MNGGAVDGYREPSAAGGGSPGAAVVLPIVVAVVRALAHGWFPVGDTALLAVRAVRRGDAATIRCSARGRRPRSRSASTSTTRARSTTTCWRRSCGRSGGSSASASATAIGVGTINAAAALGTAFVGARIGGWRAERWMLLLVAALTWSMGSELLIDIWQPHALLLPFCAAGGADDRGRLRRHDDVAVCGSASRRWSCRPTSPTCTRSVRSWCWSAVALVGSSAASR